jgi:uncharacterized protein (TIGR02246 family)
MRKAFYRAFVVLMVVFSSIAYSQESSEMAIRSRIKQYEAAYNAGDVDGMAAIYAVDGTHTYALGYTHHGRDEIANGLREQFTGPFKGTRMTITPLSIRMISSDIAVEEGAFVLAGLKGADGADLPPFNGLCLVAYKKLGDRWFIEAAQCMVPPPAPDQK